MEFDIRYWKAEEMSVKNIHILWKLYLFEWVIEDWIGILHRIFSVEKNHLILAVKNLLFLENLCSLWRIFQHLQLTYWHWNNSIMIWLIKMGSYKDLLYSCSLPGSVHDWGWQVLLKVQMKLWANGRKPADGMAFSSKWPMKV